MVQPTLNVNIPSILTGTALAANPARISFMIQNVGSNPLFVNFGGTASSSVFHAVLKGGTGDSDGLGASYSSGSVCFTGAVTFAGTSPKYVITELAP